MALRLKSLSTELAVVFASIAVVLVGLLSYFAFEMVSRALEETVRRDLLNTVDQAVVSIDGELQERVREVETISLSPTIRDSAIYLSESHATIPMRDRNEKGMRARFGGLPCLDERPEIGKNLESVQAAHTYVSNFLLTDRLGIAIGCTAPPARLLNSSQTWWQEAVRRGVSLTNLELDQSSGSYRYSVALPIPDGAREPAGVLRAVFNLRAIQDAIGAVRIGENGFLVAMSRDGRIIAHPNPDYLWKKVDEIPEVAYLRSIVDSPGTRGVMMYERREPNKAAAATAAGGGAGPHAHSGAIPGSVRPASLSGATSDTWLLGYARVFTPASLGPLGWTVVGTVSRAEVISPIAAIRRHVAAVGGLFVLLTVPLVWWVSRRLAKPLNDLAYRADLIAAGDLNVSLNIPSRNEIAQLATALSSMVDSLRESNRSLSRTNVDLERRVAERTREVQEKSRQIEEQNKQVLEASRLKSQFLANMSHELRTPLNAVLALSEILGQRISGDLNDEQVKQVTIINRSGKNLLKLINDILDLSKIEAGRMEVHLGVMQLRNAVTAVRDTIEPLANEKGLVFDVMIDPALPPLLRADDSKLRQILVNLLGNAVKFTETGKVSLVLNHRRRPLPGTEEIPARLDPDAPFWLEMIVFDTGIGISAHALEKIFDEFQQADGSTTRKYGGTGLGLAISKKLTELMGGEITLSSEMGKGSTFKVSVPADAVREEDAELEEDGSFDSSIATYVPAMPPSRLGKVRGNMNASGDQSDVNPGEAADRQPYPSHKKGKFVSPFVEHPVPISPRFLDIHDDTDKLLPHIPTLLVVDDDPESLYIYRQLLSRQGYQVIYAINGEQVMEKARHFRPVAIILDLMLPNKSGWEVLEELKITDDLKDIPVVISSVLDHRERGVCAGAFRYLTKPMTEKQFLGVLKELERIRKKDVRRVLVIDDDPVELGIARTLFEKGGLDVITKSNGLEAVAWAAAELPDIIVLDLMMPGTDGFEILSMLKADTKTASIPVLVYTAKDITDEDRQRLLPSARKIFPKVPLQIEEMLDELQRALQTVPMRDRSAIPASPVSILEPENFVPPARSTTGERSLPGVIRPEVLSAPTQTTEAPTLPPTRATAAPSREVPLQREELEDRSDSIGASGNPIPTASPLESTRSSQDGKGSGAPCSPMDESTPPIAGKAPHEETMRGRTSPEASRPLRAKILLVEDDLANQYSISFMLRAEGYHVDVASNGNDGIVAADKNRPDLILMDMMMPIMSGFDATRLIKRTPSLNEIPVIALTAAAMAGDKERTLAAGCDDYVSKPVNRALLLGRIRHWLNVVERRRAHDAEEATVTP